MSNTKEEFRCTRNSPYLHDCLGHDDIKSRQGYYVIAKTEEDALRVMARDFPKDIAGFTATFNKNVPGYVSYDLDGGA